MIIVAPQRPQMPRVHLLQGVFSVISSAVVCILCYSICCSVCFVLYHLLSDVMKIHYKYDISPATNALSSSAVVCVLFGLSTTYARGTSPCLGWGIPVTPTSATEG